MISINKQGNAIVIEFTDNDKYLFNGKIEVAPNELIVVVDQSDMITFKRASNGDVLFSQLVDDIQIAGSPVTKDTVIDQFAIIGFTSGGGGGTSNWDDIQGKPEFAEVATSGSYNDLTDKPEIPSDYIENITDSDTEFSIDTAFNYKSGKKYSLSFSKTGGFDVIIGGDTQRKINLSIDTDIIATKGDLANYQPVGDYATKTELASKQDTLVSGTNIKTVNGQSLLGEGNIEIQGGGTITVDSALSTTSENPVQNKVITNALNDKASKTELATKQDSINKYVSSITPNPQSTGFILSTISVNAEGEPSIVDFQLNNTKDPDIEFEADRTNPAQLKSYIKLSANVLKKSVADQTYATKTELEGKVDDADIADMLTKSEAASTYQPKGEYATTSQLSGKQDTLVSGTNIKTVNGNSLLGEGDITIQAGGAVDTEMSDTSTNAVQNKVIKAYIDSLVGNILTQLQEINGTN